MQQLLASIQRHSFSILTGFALLSIVGLALAPRLSLQYLPQYRQPGFSIQIQWPGANPRIMEQEIVTPLEASFVLVQGIERIYSVSELGSARITLDASSGQQLDYLRFEIASKIRQIFPRLPEGAQYPVIHDFDPDREIQDRPILTYSLSGQAEVPAIFRYARESVSSQLSLISGIKRINTVGGEEMEWLLTLDEDRMLRYGLRDLDVIQGIRRAFEDQVVGLSRLSSRQYNVRLDNLLKELNKEDWKTIPIKVIEGQLVRLGDLGKVTQAKQISRQYYRINGQNSVRLLIYPEDQVNQLALAEEIRRSIPSLQTTLPSSYRMHLEDDATEYLRQELDRIWHRTLFSLGLLMVFLFIAYQNVRYFLVVALALLVNLALTSIFYYLFQVQLHLYALAGITVSFGIIIDNAIVMSHHLYRQGNLKVFSALLASTVTTIASLLVIFFLPEKWQVNLSDFGKVLMINLFVSLVVALLFIPALLSRLDLRLSSRSGHIRQRFENLLSAQYRNLVRFVVTKKTPITVGLVLLFGLPVFMLPNKTNDLPLYDRTLGNEWFVEHIRPTLNKVLGGSLRLFVWYVYEGSTYREPDETLLYVRASMPPGSTIEQMNDVFLQIENYLRQFPVEIKKYNSNIFSGDHGQMIIHFNAGHEVMFPYLLKNRLVVYSTNMGGVTWSIYGVGRGFSNAGGGSPPRFKVSLYGYNDDVLLNQAQRLANLLLEHPRIQEVDVDANIDWYRKDRYTYEMELDYRQLAEQQISASQVLTAMQPYDQQNYPDFYLPGRQAVRLVSNGQKGNDLWRWNNKIHEVDSLKFQFSTFGEIQKQKMAQAVHKENQQYIRSIDFEYTGSHRFGSKYLDECLVQLRQEMPIGYSAERKSYDFFGKERKKQYGLLLLIIGLIFFICSIQFESFKQALTIVLLIPLSFIGIFLVFYWFDGSFDQGGYTSFILLSGLVVNSLILIINDFNHFRKSVVGISKLDAYLKAFHHKFLPIMLTIASTALGMVPFLMYGKEDVFWFALALGTIGGLTFSILIITFVIPIFLLKKSDVT